MVPFISCAQTISIIDSKIVNSDTDVTTNDAHLEVTTGTGAGNENHFDLTTKDVQSEAEFKAYSARTNDALTALTKSLADLLDITLTGGSGDDIITVASANTDDSANTFTVTHKGAHETEGFKKIKTDAYGHIVASSAVTTEDIQALGFKTSAETGEDLEALSASVVTNKTNIEALSAGTQHDIETLSGDVVEYVKVVSGNIETVINELSAGTIQLSADTHNTIVKLSGDTEAAISKAIEDLGAVSASTGKYFTAIGVNDGVLVKEEADLPTLSVESAGTGNVVASITVADHKITYQTASVATSEGIAALSASVINLSAVTGEFSGATNTRINNLSAYTEAVDDKVEKLSAATISISGFAHDEIAQLSGATVAEFNSAFTAIQAMDKAASAEDGKVVTTVSEVDGVVSETKANVKDLQLGGYVKDTAATGDIAGTDTINAALSKLENKANANKIANADGSINVTTAATGTDINVNIKSEEHVLAKDGDAGLYTNIKLSALTPSSDLVKEEYALYGTDNTILGDHIKIYKDQSLVSITLEDNDGSGHTGQYLKYTYIDASGATQSTYVNVSSFLVEAEFKSGVTADANGVVHGVVDPASEKDSNNDGFLTVGADGFKVDGIKDEIDAKIAALDKTDDAAVAGQYVAAIEETDGVVAVKTRANVSEAVLNNYTKGTDATAVAATDTVNQAISKLENQVDAAKAAATTKVVEGTDEGNNMTIVSATGADSSVTYTVNLTDVASKAALDAEIAARKAVDGQTGQTYTANTGATYITGATSLNDADVKLDTALKAVADQVEGLDYTGLTNENTKVVTDVKQENGLVSASATTVGDLVITAITTADTKVAANDSLATIAGKLQGQIDAMDSSTATTDSGHYLTAITITDGKITSIGQEELPAATPVTTVNGSTGDTAAAVIASVVTGGTEGHQLTLNYSNKVFSATTADSAVTSQSAITSLSAQTSVSANMAYEVFSAATITSGQVTDIVPGIENTKVHEAESADTAASADKVAKALSVSGYSTSSASSLDSAFAFDGSEAQSLTFGTNGPAGLKSMSMTSAGVVDVEVIDCGEY